MHPKVMDTYITKYHAILHVNKLEKYDDMKFVTKMHPKMGK